MYKWCIDITLKGSGTVIHCIYDGPESGSLDVIVNIFQGKKHDEWVALRGVTGKSQTFITVGEVASLDIYERKR